MPRMEVVPPSDGVWRWCRRRLPRPLVMECIQLRSSAAASKGPSDSRSTEVRQPHTCPSSPLSYKQISRGATASLQAIPWVVAAMSRFLFCDAPRALAGQACRVGVVEFGLTPQLQHEPTNLFLSVLASP